jgi:hypothetical protein
MLVAVLALVTLPPLVGVVIARGDPLGGLLGLVLISLPSLVALFRWLYADPEAPLQLPGPKGSRAAERQKAIGVRFHQSLTAFYAGGLSLAERVLEPLDGARVLCLEQADDVEPLIPILEPFAKDQAETPLVLAASSVSDELLQTFHVNVNRGIFAGFVVRAEPATLAELARATRGTLVRAGRRPGVRHVGRAHAVRLSAEALTVAGPRGEVTLPLGSAPEETP